MARPEDKGRPALIYGLAAAGIALYAVDLALYLSSGDVLAYGVTYLNNIIDTDPRFIWQQLWRLSYYPPLYYGFLYGTVDLVGFDFERVLVANAVFAPLGVLYLAALSRRLGLGNLSFLPGLLLLLFPGMQIASRTLTIESPLLLFVPACAYHLIASGRFRVGSHAALAGLFAGLGMLTKWSCPAYLIGPAVAVVASSFFDPETRRRVTPTAAQWRNGAIALGAALAVCGWWYTLRMDWPVFFASAGNDPNRLVYSYRLNLIDLLAEFGDLIGARLSWWLLGLAGVAFAFAKGKGRLLLLAVAGIAAPLLLFAIPVHSETRYLFPMLPAAGLVLGALCASAWRPAVGVILAAAFTGLVAHAHFGYFEFERERPPTVFFYGLDQPNQSERVMDNLLQRIAYRTWVVPTVTVHPIWKNNHLRCEYLPYVSEIRGVTKEMSFTCDAWFEYGNFRDQLYEKGVDVILLDCGESGDCPREGGDLLRHYAAAMEEYGHIDQMWGRRMNPFTAESVEEDYRFVRDNYTEIAVLPFDDGTHTRILVSRWMADKMERRRSREKAYGAIEPPGETEGQSVSEETKP